MYSRNYYETDDSPKLPENYDGTTLRSSEKEEVKSEVKQNGEETVLTSAQKDKTSFFSSFPKSIQIPAFLGKLGINSLSLPRLGTEEIILIAAAAYLFFSKEGDKECAVMLILLLFVS